MGKISILSSVANMETKMNSECALVSPPEYLAPPSPAYVILRMDPGDLMNIVFIVHLLLVSLLCRNVPLFSGFSLISQHGLCDPAPPGFFSLVCLPLTCRLCATHQHRVPSHTYGLCLEVSSFIPCLASSLSSFKFISSVRPSRRSLWI